MRRSYVTAGGIALLAVLWIGSGLVTGNGPEREQSASEALAAGNSAEVQRVRVQRLSAQEKESTIKLAGRTVAARNVQLKAETDGQVVALEVQRGQLVEQGQPLIRIAMDDRSALLARAEALVGQREKEFDAAEELSKKSFTSEVSLASARASLEAARADLRSIQVDIDRTVIRAPFDGVFDMNHVEVGAYVRTGDDVADFLDLDPILVRAELSELSIAGVNLDGDAIAGLLDGHVLRGPVTYVSRTANPATRTFVVEMSAPNVDQSLAEGLTASLELPARTVRAHRIPPAALTLNDAGEVGIKVVNADNTVTFISANIVAADTADVWIEDLPEVVSVITVGQEFVRDGDTVVPVYTDPVQPVAGGASYNGSQDDDDELTLPGLSGAAAVGGLQ